MICDYDDPAGALCGRVALSAALLNFCSKYKPATHPLGNRPRGRFKISGAKIFLTASVSATNQPLVSCENSA